MANQDARPFVDLKKDAEEFQTKFDEDIKECISFLDAKITALICDPDSLGNSVKSLDKSAFVEFSKSKYDAFISVKSFINAKEREWLAYISAMKQLFVENVEIFLAATKLEVKFPSSEYQSSSGSKKSPGSQNPFSVFKDITRNVPAETDVQSNRSNRLSAKFNSTLETDVQSNRSGRLSAKFNNTLGTIAKISQEDENMEVSDDSENESGKVGYKAQFNRKGSFSFKLDSALRGTLDLNQKEDMISSDSSENEDRTVDNVNCNKRGRRPNTSVKLPNTSRKSNFSDAVEKSKTAEVNVKPGRRLRGRKETRNDVNCPLENEIAENVNFVDEEPLSNKVVRAAGRRGRSVAPKSTNTYVSENEIAENVNVVNEEDPTVEVAKTKGRRARSAAPKSSNNTISDSTVSARPTRGRKSVRNVDQTYESVPLSQNTNLTSSDEHSESDLHSSVTRPARNTRRKTFLPRLDNVPDSDIIPARTVSKRKTIGGASELNTAVPPKRLKASNKKVASIQEEDAADDNLLESDENYSDWMALKNLDGKIPTAPAVYEVKVWRAKKPAYIGSSESLRQKLTLYKLRQNSGHKHLDKFLDRNFNDIQIRFEVMPSVKDAENEVKTRVKHFVEQHKTTPAYN